MTERLLRILISTAGPRLARVLAAAIINFLHEVTDRTPTEIDDELLALILHTLGQKVEDTNDEPR